MIMPEGLDSHYCFYVVQQIKCSLLKVVYTITSNYFAFQDLSDANVQPQHSCTAVSTAYQQYLVGTCPLQQKPTTTSHNYRNQRLWQELLIAPCCFDTSAFNVFDMQSELYVQLSFTC